MTTHMLTFKDKLEAYIHLTRFDKPVGIELVFWSTLWAVFLAAHEYGQLPPWHVVVIFALGATLMRAAGCAINDFADRKVDGHVARTKGRPLADGRLSSKEAVWTFLILSWISASLLVFLPLDVFIWSFGAVSLAFIYPFMKRYTHLPQVFLGAAFSWSIPMAYTAVGVTPDLTCWLLYFGNLAWTVAYDTQYAITDREYDLKIGVKSTAILFGRYDIQIISLLQAVSVFLIGTALWLESLLIPFGLAALLVVVADFIYQWLKTKDKDPQRCFWAFRHNRWVGLIIFSGIVLALM